MKQKATELTDVGAHNNMELPPEEPDLIVDLVCFFLLILHIYLAQIPGLPALPGLISTTESVQYRVPCDRQTESCKGWAPIRETMINITPSKVPMSFDLLTKDTPVTWPCSLSFAT